jgi:hypothetical protein
MNITQPTEGHVVLDLDWKDAVILSRALGRVNSGDLLALSPLLHDFVLDMVEEVGRDIPSEATMYATEVRASQIYMTEI